MCKALDRLTYAVNRVADQLGDIVATLKEVLDNIAGWGTSWRDRAKAAEANAAAERAAKESALATLAAERAADAETDAAQLQAQVDADIAEAQRTYDTLAALDTPAEEPPVEEPVEEPTDG